MNRPTNTSASRVVGESRPVTLASLSRRSKAILICSAAAIAFVSMAINNLSSIAAFVRGDRATLEIDSVNVVDDADVPYLDIVVRNTGTRVALVTSAKVAIERIVEAPDGLAGAGLTIEDDDSYSVTVTISRDLPVHAVATDLRRQIPSDGVDRFQLAYDFEMDHADDDETIHLLAYQMSVELTYNGDEIESAGPFVANHHGLNHFTSLAIYAKENIDTTELTNLENAISEIESLDGERSKTTERLVKFVRNALSK